MKPNLTPTFGTFIAIYFVYCIPRLYDGMVESDILSVYRNVGETQLKYKFRVTSQDEITNNLYNLYGLITSSDLQGVQRNMTVGEKL